MDPNTRLWLSKSRIAEFHAEAAADHLAREARNAAEARTAAARTAETRIAEARIAEARKRGSVASPGMQITQRVRALFGGRRPAARTVAPEC